MTTITSNLNLIIPDKGDTDWEVQADENYQKIDAALSSTVSGSHIVASGTTIHGEAIFEGLGSVSLHPSGNTVVISGSPGGAGSGDVTESQLVTVSGFLQGQIDSIDVDELEDALIGAGTVTVISGSNIITISGAEGSFENDDDVDSLNTVTGTITLAGVDGLSVITESQTITVSGFRSEFVSASGSLQTQIDAIDIDEADVSSLEGLQGDLTLAGADGISISDNTVSEITVTGFRNEFVSTSGSLQGQIDGLDSIYATDSELTTTSGHLQSQIDSIDVDETEDAIIGVDGITIISGSNTVTVSGFRTEFVSVSGSLQTQIDAIDVDEADVSSLEGLQGDLTLAGADGITISDDASSEITITGFRTEFVSASGSLQSQINTNTTDIATNSGNISSNTSLIVTTSGHLQSQINSIDVDEIENAIVGVDGITVISGSNTTTVSGFRNEFLTASGIFVKKTGDTMTGTLNASFTQAQAQSDTPFLRVLSFPSPIATSSGVIINTPTASGTGKKTHHIIGAGGGSATSDFTGAEGGTLEFRFNPADGVGGGNNLLFNMGSASFGAPNTTTVTFLSKRNQFAVPGDTRVQMTFASAETALEHTYGGVTGKIFRIRSNSGNLNFVSSAGIAFDIGDNAVWDFNNSNAANTTFRLRGTQNGGAFEFRTSSFGNSGAFSFGQANFDNTALVRINPPAANGALTAKATTTDFSLIHAASGVAPDFELLNVPRNMYTAWFGRYFPITTSGIPNNTATVYIENANTFGVKNYALWVDDGEARFDSRVSISGVLTLPRYTDSQKDALTGNEPGDVIYLTASGQPAVYNGTTWRRVVLD